MPKKRGSKTKTGEQMGEQIDIEKAETVCLCGFQAFIRWTPAHMQIQGRSLASSERPFSLGICCVNV